MLDKEVPNNQIPPKDGPLYHEAEEKEWADWLKNQSVKIRTFGNAVTWQHRGGDDKVKWSSPKKPETMIDLDNGPGPSPDPQPAEQELSLAYQGPSHRFLEDESWIKNGPADCDAADKKQSALVNGSQPLVSDKVYKLAAVNAVDAEMVFDLELATKEEKKTETVQNPDHQRQQLRRLNRESRHRVH